MSIGPIHPTQPATIVHRKRDRGDLIEVSRRDLPVSASQLRRYDADRSGSLDRDEITTFMRASLVGPRSGEKPDLIRMICLSENQAAELRESPEAATPATQKRIAFLESLGVTAIDMLISDWRDTFEIELPQHALQGVIGCKGNAPASGEAAQPPAPQSPAIAGERVHQGLETVIDRLRHLKR